MITERAMDSVKTVGLPCPFCGAGLVRSEEFSNRSRDIFVHELPAAGETDCPARGIILDKSDLAKWNRRAASPPAGAEVAGLRYRPNKHDDWGMIRDADGALFAVVHRPLSAEEAAQHRQTGSDPYEPLARALLAGLAPPTPSTDAVRRQEREADEWRPIETAPKTGFFMAWSPDFPDIPAVWKAEIFHSARAPGTPKHLASLHWTHWRPTPEPPALSTPPAGAAALNEGEAKP